MKSRRTEWRGEAVQEGHRGLNRPPTSGVQNIEHGRSQERHPSGARAFLSDIGGAIGLETIESAVDRSSRPRASPDACRPAHVDSPRSSGLETRRRRRPVSRLTPSPRLRVEAIDRLSGASRNAVHPGTADHRCSCAASTCVSRRASSWSIMGPSGSGKSTPHAGNLRRPLDAPTRGEVFFQESTAPLDARPAIFALLRRTKIGFIFQFFNLLPTLTAVENVALPLLLGGQSRRTALKPAYAWSRDAVEPQGASRAFSRRDVGQARCSASRSPGPSSFSPDAVLWRRADRQSRFGERPRNPPDAERCAAQRPTRRRHGDARRLRRGARRSRHPSPR